MRDNIKEVPECIFCNSENVAVILYGVTCYSEDLEIAINARKIVIGGSSKDYNSPRWHCNDCGKDW
jgi:hypothetical protein